MIGPMALPWWTPLVIFKPLFGKNPIGLRRRVMMMMMMIISIFTQDE
jgi:hypothetical protein